MDRKNFLYGRLHNRKEKIDGEEEDIDEKESDGNVFVIVE